MRDKGGLRCPSQEPTNGGCETPAIAATHERPKFCAVSDIPTFSAGDNIQEPLSRVSPLSDWVQSQWVRMTPRGDRGVITTATSALTQHYVVD
jgi:hypothetical protein